MIACISWGVWEEEQGFRTEIVNVEHLDCSGTRLAQWLVNITKRLTTVGSQQQGRRWCRKQSMAGQNIFRGLEAGWAVEGKVGWQIGPGVQLELSISHSG